MVPRHRRPSDILPGALGFTFSTTLTVLDGYARTLGAGLNFAAMRGAWVPAERRPGPVLSALSWGGIVFLAGFGVVWGVVRF